MAIGKHGAVVRQLRVLFDLGAIRELTDGQLLERFASSGGEVAELAFAALVERHGPMVLRVCRGVLSDPHASQDAFQATFLVLVQKARGLWVRDSLGPWLYQVAFRTASCHRLAAARRHRHERSGAALRNEACLEAHDDELERALHEEIERLPERFRAPLVLCDLEGRSHEQAARHLGWPVGTVKSRQARGRDRLRDRLRRRGVAPHAAVLSAALRPDVASALVSPALVESTIKAALEFLSLRTIVPGTVSTLAQGVLSSMYLTQCLKVVSVLLVLGVTASGTGLLAQRGRQTAAPGPGGQAHAAGVDQAPTTAVKPGNLRVIVSERGSLEARFPNDAYCLVEGRTTIVSILPEGSAVKNGQIVCRLDSAGLKDQLVNQKITVKAAEANYQNAKLTREVAEIAVTEYRDGIYKQDLATLKNEVTAAESAIEKADARVKRTELARKRLQETMAKKGANSSPSDILADLDIEDRLEFAGLTLLRERMALEHAQGKKALLEKITFPKTIRELRDEVERTKSAELAKQATWELEIAKERKLERQILACDIKAPRDGTLVFANDPNRRPGLPANIDEGATVRERQKIFSVVDLAGTMQVNTKVHESQIDKLSQKMKAKIRVDAFPDQIFDGAVVEVAPLPDPTTFANPNVKVYTTRVKLDKPVPGLRPGMTAQVEILVAERDDVLSVPVEALIQFDDKYHVAVKKRDGVIEFREVELGMSNQKLVEIKQGIKSGDVVVAKPLDLLNDKRKSEIGRNPAQPSARPGNPQ